MKVIVLGANGMAGHMAVMYLAEQGYEVTGFAKKKNSFCNCIEGDALDKNCVRELLRKGGYDAVINCIGILNKAVDAKLADGIYLNSVLPHFLSECVKDMDTKIIQISSDCIFSGNEGGYKESSKPDAESYYGKTKALGELLDDKNLTFRTSIVGPELKMDGIGLFHWFMGQTGFVNGFTEVIWSGVTTLELARAIDAALKQNITGLYHLTNNETISKHDLLCLFNQYMNDNRTVIHENGSFSNDKSIIDTRKELRYKVPSYEEMIANMADWMQSHEVLYRYYFERQKERR